MSTFLNLDCLIRFIIRIKLWCNCGTVPQLYPTVGFSLIQMNPTHLSGSNGWCNCGTVPQLHCNLTLIIVNIKIFLIVICIWIKKMFILLFSFNDPLCPTIIHKVSKRDYYQFFFSIITWKDIVVNLPKQKASLIF